MQWRHCSVSPHCRRMSLDGRTSSVSRLWLTLSFAPLCRFIQTFGKGNEFMLKWLEGLSMLYQRYAKQYAKVVAMRELIQAEIELERAIRRVALARIRAGQARMH